MTMTEYVPNPYTDALAAIIADSLPDRVTLVDPDYRDELSPVDVQRCIREGSDAVRDTVNDWAWEAEHESMTYYATEYLPGWIAAMGKDDAVWEAVRETLWERDNSDPVAAMLRQFGSFDTLVPPNFSTTQDGPTCVLMLSSGRRAGRAARAAAGIRRC